MMNHSMACERNKDPIAEQLKQWFVDCSKVLEVGSGSGQHVLHFAEQMPHIQWQPMDFGEYFEGLAYNLRQRPAPVNAPVELNLDHMPWLPDQSFDGLFSANTLHIMSWQHVLGFFERAGQQLSDGAVMCIYGPFKYNGQYTSESNAHFNVWLKDRDPLSGVRDFEAVVEQAELNGFGLKADNPMPANNQLLVFVKTPKEK